MWSEGEGGRSRRWRRRVAVEGRGEESCGEVHVVIREDGNRGPYPVVTRVNGLPAVQRFIMRQRVRGTRSLEHSPSRTVLLQVSDRVVLKLSATSGESDRSELVATLGLDEMEAPREFELGEVGSQDRAPSRIASNDFLKKLPRVDSETLKGRPCTICCEEFTADGEVVRLPCEHLYHISCIYNWLLRHNSCPACRTRVAEDEQCEIERDSKADSVAHIDVGSRLANDSLPATSSSTSRLQVEETVDGFYRLRLRSRKTSSGRQLPRISLVQRLKHMYRRGYHEFRRNEASSTWT